MLDNNVRITAVHTTASASASLKRSQKAQTTPVPITRHLGIAQRAKKRRCGDGIVKGESVEAGGVGVRESVRGTGAGVKVLVGVLVGI
jgi:hypothetical protein